MDDHKVAQRVHLFFRFRAIYLLQDWDRFTYGDVEEWLGDYLHDLYMNCPNMYEDQREAKDDLEIITGLLHTLKSKIAEAEICYYQSEIAYFDRTKKVGMMLQKLESIIKEGNIADVKFLEWIQRMLGKVGWKEDLKFVKNTNGWKEKALSAGAQFAEKIKAFEEFSVEDIDVEKPDYIVKRLEQYLQEQEDVPTISQETTSYVCSGPNICALIKEVKCKLTNICAPDDEIKEEPSDDVQSPIQAVDSAEKETSYGVQSPIQAFDSGEKETSYGVQSQIQAVDNAEKETSYGVQSPIQAFDSGEKETSYGVQSQIQEVDSVEKETSYGVQSQIQAVDSAEKETSYGVHSPIQAFDSAVDSAEEIRENEESVDEILGSLKRYRECARSLLQDWDRFAYDDVEECLGNYLHDLYMNCPNMYEDQREVNDDLEIITGLLHTLKSKIAEAEICYYQSEIAYFDRTKKVGMMLQKLESIIKEGNISDGKFLEWIQRMLGKVGWKDDLKFVKNTNGWKEKALSAGAQFAEKIKAFEEFNVEDIDVEKPDDIVKRLEEYLREQEDVPTVSQETTSYMCSAPKICALIEEVVCKLTVICAPDDSIKEEPSDDIQSPIQAVDSAEEERPDGVLIQEVEIAENKETKDEMMHVPHQEMRDSLHYHRKLAICVLNHPDSITDPEMKWLQENYLNYMYTNSLLVYEDQREAQVDIEVLTGVLTILKSKIVEGVTYFIQSQIAFFYARKKVGMILQKLESTSDGVGVSLVRIRGMLGKVEWEKYISIVENTNWWKEKALAAGAQFALQIKAFEEFTVEDIDVEKPDDIVKRLEEYINEEVKARKILRKEADFITSCLASCRFIELIMCKLTDI